MRIVSRAHPYLQKYIELAFAIGMSDFEHLVDHGHYCEIHNRPERANNQIFLLRRARASELERIDPRLAHDKMTGVMIEELRSLAMEALPQQIATFRIVRCEEDPNQVFAYNEQSEKSPTKRLDYFHPRSLATFRRRCLGLMNFVWLGPENAIQPFYDYCLDQQPARN